MRRFVIPVLIALLAALAPEASGAGFFRRMTSLGDDYFPRSDAVPGLKRIGKIVTYRGENFNEFYGTAGNRYIQYGMVRLLVAEYAYGGDDRRLSIELAVMETPAAAAGLFHFHRGRTVAGGGEAAAVGAEAVLDTERGGRNLYFYRSNNFVKIIYSGKEPVPDLLPVAKAMDAEMPSGRDDKPDGFAYIDVPGVDQSTVELTPGFTFNISFLPPSVWASAPGGGNPGASDLFIVTRVTERDAMQSFKDYTAYLKLSASYVEEYRRGKQAYVKAVDPEQGRVVCAAYKNAFIIAARPDGYEKGEALINLVIAKIDEVQGAKRRR